MEKIEDKNSKLYIELIKELLSKISTLSITEVIENSCKISQKYNFPFITLSDAIKTMQNYEFYLLFFRELITPFFWANNIIKSKLDITQSLQICEIIKNVLLKSHTLFIVFDEIFLKKDPRISFIFTVFTNLTNSPDNDFKGILTNFMFLDKFVENIGQFKFCNDFENYSTICKGTNNLLTEIHANLQISHKIQTSFYKSLLKIWLKIDPHCCSSDSAFLAEIKTNFPKNMIVFPANDLLFGITCLDGTFAFSARVVQNSIYHIERGRLNDKIKEAYLIYFILHQITFKKILTQNSCLSLYRKNQDIGYEILKNGIGIEPNFGIFEFCDERAEIITDFKQWKTKGINKKFDECKKMHKHNEQKSLNEIYGPYGKICFKTHEQSLEIYKTFLIKDN